MKNPQDKDASFASKATYTEVSDSNLRMQPAQEAKMPFILL